MLKVSFSCFQGLSIASECRLWKLGCLAWHTFSHMPEGTFSSAKQEVVRQQILLGEAALEAGMPDFFLNRLPGSDRVRVLHDFRELTAFLDIETTGLSKQDCITTVAILVNDHLAVFTRGTDLNKFLASLNGIRLLVTYNGTRFDLPFLRRTFGIDLAIPHLDLMPVLAGIGLKGGQKACEIQAGLTRIHSQRTDGVEAVKLWERFASRGDRKALKELILYNAEDVVMLERLAVMAYNHSMSAYPLHIQLTSRVPPKWGSDFVHASAL